MTTLQTNLQKLITIKSDNTQLVTKLQELVVNLDDIKKLQVFDVNSLAANVKKIVSDLQTKIVNNLENGNALL